MRCAHLQHRQMNVLISTVTKTATLTPASIHPVVAPVSNTATAKPASSAAGLVNSATGTVVSVIYDNADSTALIAGKYAPSYCIVVHFSGFRGFLTKTGQRSHPFPNQPHWVPDYREKFVAARADLPYWIVMKQEVKDCWRVQFPLDLCRAMTCH